MIQYMYATAFISMFKSRNYEAQVDVNPINCIISYFIISFSMGGLILDFAVGNYHGIAVFQPVINGKSCN